MKNPIMENFHFPFEILLCPFGELERDVQIFITIMIEPLMEFFHFLFKILIFSLLKHIKGFQVFIMTVIKPIMEFPFVI